MTRRATVVTLVAIVLFGLWLRLRFATGVVFNDDLGYAQSALDLLHGHFRLAEWPGGQSRIGLFAPVTFFYWLLGPSETTSILFPLLCSLAAIVLAFGLGQWFADERAGLIAAFLWAVFPLDIQSATALLPDGPVTFFSAATVYLFLRGSDAKSSRGCYAAACVCLLWAALIKPTGLIGFGAVLLLMTRLPRVAHRTFVIAGMSVVTALVGAYYVFWGGMQETADRLPVAHGFQAVIETAADWTLRLLHDPTFAAFTPLAIVATALILLQPSSRATLAVSWAGAWFLFFEMGSVSPLRYVPVSSALRAGQVLFVLLPFAVVSGLALAELASRTTARVVVIAASAIVAIAAWWHSGPFVSWMVLDIDQNELPFFGLSTLALAVAMFGSIVIPGLGSRLAAPWRGPLLGVLLAGIGLASLHPAQAKTLETAFAWHDNLKAIAGFLEQQPPHPVFVENQILAGRLNVASRFTLGLDYWAPNNGTGRLRLVPEDLDALPADAYVVVDDEHLQAGPAPGQRGAPAYLKQPPADWSLLLTAGDHAGHQTRLYRFSLADAERDFERARTSVASAASAANLLGLVQAASGARDFCAATDAYLRLLTIERTSAEAIDPSAILRACASKRPDVLTPNLLKNGDFSAGLDAWAQHPEARATRTVVANSGEPRHVHVEFRGGNWVVLSQPVPLEPDSAYLYRMRVRSTTPIVSLYWQADVSRHLEDGLKYAQWTELVLPFVTPHWNGSQTTAHFSPVLIHAPGDVWIADVQLRRFQLVPQITTRR